jgi:hypothetical protein
MLCCSTPLGERWHVVVRPESLGCCKFRQGGSTVREYESRHIASRNPAGALRGIDIPQTTAFKTRQPPQGRFMSTLLILTIITVAIVLFFDYTNGFHDAANIVATIIASRAMTPVQAVIIVGTFEFLGPLLGGTAVANTIGKFVTLGDVQAVLSLAILISG